MDPDKVELQIAEEEAVRGGSRIDSKTNQLNDLLIEKLEHAFHKHTSQVMVHELVKIAIEHDPIDLAHVATRLPPGVRYLLYENLPDMRAKMLFMMNTGSNTHLAIFRYISDEEIKQLIEKMPPDEAVSVLEDLSDRRLRRVLDLLESKKAARIKEVLKHSRDSAGRLMTNEYFSFLMNTKIGQVAARIRDNPGIELTRSIFVIGEEGELIGYVPARNLIVNPDNVPIRQVMKPVLHKILPEATKDEVVDVVERYKIPTLPVVDENDKLLGVITYEDVLEAMEDIADQTIANIAGTAEGVGESAPLVRRYLWRAPWLIVTLFAGLVTATVLTYFSTQPWFVFPIIFVPLITGMSGNVGIQCSTILVRGMATGEITSGTKKEVCFREMAIGFLIGITFGILCGVVVFLLNELGVLHINEKPLVIGSVVTAGLFGACGIATLLGSLSPLFFAKLRIDPAVASGPIVTAFNDVLSTITYFLIAKGVILLFHGSSGLSYKSLAL